MNAPACARQRTDCPQGSTIDKDGRRQPFLDFASSRVNAGSQQKFRVSGAPMFNQITRFIGYRGIGVETTARNLEHEISMVRHATIP